MGWHYSDSGVPLDSTCRAGRLFIEVDRDKGATVVPTTFAFDDIDGDGVNDLAVSSWLSMAAQGVISWLRNTGNGTFDPPSSLHTVASHGANRVVIADVYVWLHWHYSLR